MCEVKERHFINIIFDTAVQCTAMADLINLTIGCNGLHSYPDFWQNILSGDTTTKTYTTQQHVTSSHVGGFSKLTHQLYKICPPITRIDKTKCLVIFYLRSNVVQGVYKTLPCNFMVSLYLQQQGCIKFMSFIIRFKYLQNVQPFIAREQRSPKEVTEGHQLLVFLVWGTIFNCWEKICTSKMYHREKNRTKLPYIYP